MNICASATYYYVGPNYMNSTQVKNAFNSAQQLKFAAMRYANANLEYRELLERVYRHYTQGRVS